MSISLSIVSWNVCGARWLDLPGGGRAPQEYSIRNQRRKELNDGISYIIAQHHPEIVAFQEMVEYSLNGCWDDRMSMVDTPDGYRYDSFILVKSTEDPQSNKWKNARTRGQWPTSAVFGQGNAFLIRKDLSIFPPSSIPQAGVAFAEWLQSFLPDADHTVYLSSCIRHLHLDSRVYIGDRDTEARGCSLLHIVFPLPRCGQNDMPLDVFVLNTHLTTLLSEEPNAGHGKRKPCDQAVALRKDQLNRILLETVLPYENWVQNHYPIRGKPVESGVCETSDRWAPLWIVLGDFNFYRDSAEYSWFTNNGFSHLPHGEECVIRAEDNGDTPSTAVDHVFVRPSWEYTHLGPKYHVLGFATPMKTTNVSDHCPILTKIEIAT